MTIQARSSSWARAFGVVGIGCLGVALIVGSGSSGDGSDEGVAPNGVHLPDIETNIHTPSSFPTLDIERGGTATVRIDLVIDDENAGANPSVTVTGFSTDLPELPADIDIATESCPPGEGSPSCKVWRISPGLGSTPGRYKTNVTPSQPSVPVRQVLSAPLTINVLPDGVHTFGATSVDSSFSHTLFVDSAQHLWGFGLNANGQVAASYLRTDAQANVLDAQPFEVPVPIRLGASGDRWLSVLTVAPSAVGPMYGSFGIKTTNLDRTVWSWGPTPVTSIGLQSVVTPPDIVAIADAGGPRPAMLDSHGRLYHQATGQLMEIGTGSNSTTPVTNARGIASLGSVVYAVLADGRVVIFDHRTGIGGSPLLREVRGYNGIKKLAGGRSHLLALHETGTVYGLGGNNLGQLGTGGLDDQPCTVRICPSAGSCDDEYLVCSPVPVSSLAGVTDIAAKGDRSFALLADGAVRVWGGGLTLPTAVADLPSGIRAIGPGYAIAADCNVGGTLWEIRVDTTSPHAVRVRGVGVDDPSCARQPDIGIEVSPSRMTVDLGRPAPSGSTRVRLFRDLYAGPVTLAVDPCPGSCTFVPSTLGPSDTDATLTVSLTPSMRPVEALVVTVTGNATGGVPPATDTFVFQSVGAGDVAPTADFTFAPPAPPAGQPVTFDASVSTDDEPLVMYQWDFTNDGMFDATGITASFAYATPGAYTVRLRVTDADGGTDDVNYPINVQPALPTMVTLEVQTVGPGAVLIFSPAQTCRVTCSETYSLVTPPAIVQLTAVSDPNGQFNGWSGDCSGTGNANVAMSASRSCTATFALVPPPPSGWRSLGVVTSLPVAGRPVLEIVDPFLPPAVAYLESGATINHLVVKGYDSANGTWGPFAGTIGVVNPNAVADTTSFDFDIGDAGTVIAWNEGNTVKVSRLVGATWVTLSTDLSIAGTAIPKDSIQLATRFTGFEYEIVVAWREFVGPIRAAVARLDTSGNVLSRGYVPGVDGFTALRVAESGARLITLAYVLGDGVVEGATRVVRETQTGWEQLGGDAAPGSGTQNAALLKGFALSYSSNDSSPVVIGNTGTALTARSFSAGVWAFQRGSDPAFVTIPAGDTLATAALAHTEIPGDGSRFAYSRVRSITGGGFEFLFDVLQYNLADWIPLATTLVQTDGGQRFGAAYGTAGVFIARVREIGGATGMEMHQYVL